MMPFPGEIFLLRLSCKWKLLEYGGKQRERYGRSEDISIGHSTKYALKQVRTELDNIRQVVFIICIQK